MTVTNDSIGDRMKRQYEDRTRYLLPRRTYTILRLDGVGFHRYTAGLDRPFDCLLMKAMDETALTLCAEIQGAQCAFVQSDEISILLTDFATINTDAWFDGNIQKIVSVSAAKATYRFCLYRACQVGGAHRGLFDCRAFTIPDRTEVENYFIWRQQDATRNSIASVAQSLYSHKELYGKNVNEQQEMIYAKGQNWNDYAGGAKRGRFVRKSALRWQIEAPPIFTQDRAYLSAHIPVYPQAEPTP